jgi:undecaprenyl-diphosphatase
MLEMIQAWDEAILKKINLDWAHPLLDFLLVYMADYSLMKWPMIAGIIVILIWGSFRTRAFLVLIGMCLLVGDAGVVSTMKDMTNRPRPHETVEGTRLIDWEDGKKTIRYSKGHQPERGRSMPSGHVCNNVAIGMTVTLLFGTKGLWIWIWVVMMSYSRIYTGDHYLSDVIVSYVLSGAYSFGIYCFLSWLWQVVGSKTFPKLYERHPKLNIP